MEYRNSDFNRFISDDLTLCKNMVNFSPVTAEFEKGKDVHPLVDQQFGYCYAAPLLDLAGISTKFSRTITTQFSFTYTLEGVNAMPRGLHDRLCHAFLVKEIATGKAIGKCSGSSYQRNIKYSRLERQASK